MEAEYPVISTQPPIFEETLQNGQIVQGINYQTSGFCLYRMLSEDNRYMVAIQQNFILFHWVRGDDMKVGAYPGFDTVFSKFNTLIDKFNEIHNRLLPTLNTDKQISSYLLTYVDRFEYIQGMKVSDIFNLDIETIIPQHNDDQLVFSVKSASKLDKINGFSITEIGTVKDIFENVLVSTSYKLKGKSEDMKSWFYGARKLQNLFFQGIFTENTKNKWKDE